MAKLLGPKAQFCKTMLGGTAEHSILAEAEFQIMLEKRHKAAWGGRENGGV